MDGLLVLSNGLTFQGRIRGARKPTSGEVIFNTAMSGYQEILTDPSYCGQIITMTYPHIGNYGVNLEDMESRGSFASGMVVKELSRVVSNWRASGNLDNYLSDLGVTILEGVDTRALVIALRDQGAVPGMIVEANGVNLEKIREQARALPGMEGVNLARQVSIGSAYRWSEINGSPAVQPAYRVIAYDFGIKYNILRCLSDRGVDVEVVPYNFPAEEVLARNPDGIFLSNGPGDPEPVREAIEIVRELLGKKPIFGICLGHQILGLALGASTYKLKFGHHGGNHPVKNLDTGKIEITSQNHGFAVEESSLPQNVRVTHLNLNDNTIEGIECREKNAFSVQYHPEASPGPHDSSYLFDRFIERMKG